MSEHTHSARLAPVWLGRGVALFVVGAVATTYAVCLQGGRWPLGHPWAPIALISVALGNLAPLSHRSLRFAFAALAVLASVLWMVAASHG